MRYELRPTGGGSWTTIATASGAPFSATWDATTVSSGSYDLQPVITDNAGNTFTGATRTFTVDVSAPTVVLTNPGATISGSVTLNATVTGSGATQVVFGATPAGGGSWSTLGTDTSAPWSTTFDSTHLADGVYDLRATVSDNLGNTSSDVVASIRVDNTAPHVISSTPAEGSTVTSANAIELIASEPATPLNVTLDGHTTVAPVISGTQIDYGTGALATGAHTLAGELQDSTGKRAPFRVHFTVYAPGSSTPAPPVDKNTSSGSSTTVSSADGFAAATMPAGAWTTSGPTGSSCGSRRLAAPAGLTNGFGSGPEALDVTARWALAGTEVHQFGQPIEILMRSTERGLVPATFENGQWRVLARVPSAGTLPGGWEDGFWTDGSGFHVLTKHLSVFALLHDLQAPNPPQNVRGYMGPSGLTIRWTPGSDNSGTYDFITVFSNSSDIGHFGVDYTAAGVGSWSIGDTRVFRLKETDLAGNESELTRPLVPVPSLIGKTPDQIAALLEPLASKSARSPPAARVRAAPSRARPTLHSRKRVPRSTSSSHPAVRGRPGPQGHDRAEDQADQAQEDRGPRARHARLAGHRAALQPEAREALHLALLGAGRPLDRQPSPPQAGATPRRLQHPLDRAVRQKHRLAEYRDPVHRAQGQACAACARGPRWACCRRGSRQVLERQSENRDGVRRRADVRCSGEPKHRRARDRGRRQPVRHRNDPRPARSLPCRANRRAGARAEADGSRAQGGRCDRATALDVRAMLARIIQRLLNQPVHSCQAGAQHRLAPRSLTPLAARFPERLVAAGLGVGKTRGDEEKVGEPVEVGQHERVDPVFLVRGDRIALGAAAGRAGDVQTRGALGAAGKDEALQHRQVGVEVVAQSLQAIDRSLVDTQPVADTERDTEVAPTSKSSFWILSSGARRRSAASAPARTTPDRGVQLVDRAERADPAIELGTREPSPSDVSPPSPIARR